MTKFILAGGYPYKAKDGGKAFYEAMIEDHKEPIKILICEFARKDKNHEELFRRGEGRIKKILHNKKLEMRMASYNNFRNEIIWADVIYLEGGNSLDLLDELIDIKDLEELLISKTLVGSSAGSNVMGKYYYGLSGGRLREGLNLIPVKVLVHYKSDYLGEDFDWDEAYKKLDEFKDRLPILALREGEFKVLEK